MMDEKKLSQLLKQADGDLNLPPFDAGQLSSVIRQKFKQRRQIRRTVGGISVMILVAAGIFAQQQYQVRRK